MSETLLQPTVHVLLELFPPKERPTQTLSVAPRVALRVARGNLNPLPCSAGGGGRGGGSWWFCDFAASLVTMQAPRAHQRSSAEKRNIRKPFQWHHGQAFHPVTGGCQLHGVRKAKVGGWLGGRCALNLSFARVHTSTRRLGSDILFCSSVQCECTRNAHALEAY